MFSLESAASSSGWGLCLLVFGLGMRHGFDADHLATIDGLTRHNALHRPSLARWCGALFSLGHGAIVVVTALLVGLFSASLTPPDWMEGLGTGISVFFLLWLGALNLGAVFTAPRDSVVQPVGLKGRWLGAVMTTSSPGLVAAIGGLFALSFDTLSQTALFALLGVAQGGTLYALSLGGVFTLGMLTTDALNGFWIARLLRRADRSAWVASRVMGLAVAFLSLLVATFALLRWGWPDFAGWMEGRELWLGCLVVLVMAASYGLAQLLARRQPGLAAE